MDSPVKRSSDWTDGTSPIKKIRYTATVQTSAGEDTFDSGTSSMESSPVATPGYRHKANSSEMLGDGMPDLAPGSENLDIGDTCTDIGQVVALISVTSVNIGHSIVTVTTRSTFDIKSVTEDTEENGRSTGGTAEDGADDVDRSSMDETISSDIELNKEVSKDDVHVLYTANADSLVSHGSNTVRGINETTDAAGLSPSTEPSNAENFSTAREGLIDLVRFQIQSALVPLMASPRPVAAAMVPTDRIIGVHVIRHGNEYLTLKMWLQQKITMILNAEAPGGRLDNAYPVLALAMNRVLLEIKELILMAEERLWSDIEECAQAYWTKRQVHVLKYLDTVLGIQRAANRHNAGITSLEVADCEAATDAATYALADYN